MIARWYRVYRRAIFISINIMCMSNSEERKHGIMSALSKEEARLISGGWSLTGFLIDCAKAGAAYFFNMGLNEGRRVRAIL